MKLSNEAAFNTAFKLQCRNVPSSTGTGSAPSALGPAAGPARAAATPGSAGQHRISHTAEPKPNASKSQALIHDIKMRK